MKRILGTFTSSIAFAAIAVAGNASSSDQIAAESQRANESFDKCWDETLARHPVDESLGDKFDIRQFHKVVLSNGSVPLDVLEELVDRWIKSKQAG